ncbi:MAG TPA: FHA domain-containing protein, partial [Gemmataceae bacterium]|nr:FHA domain-containing protein [Gemmataceae bacterium]
MASLIMLQGPNAGHSYPLEGAASVIGRQPDSAVYLESLAVSRHHARVVCEGGRYFLEDLHSSNGTFLNGKRLAGRAPLTEHDAIQIGPYVLGLRLDTQPTPFATPAPSIEASIPALPSNRTLYAQNAEHKLGLVLEVARQLARSPDLDTLLHNLLDHLLALFPQTDRGLIL